MEKLIQQIYEFAKNFPGGILGIIGLVVVLFLLIILLYKLIKKAKTKNPKKKEAPKEGPPKVALTEEEIKTLKKRRELEFRLRQQKRLLGG